MTFDHKHLSFNSLVQAKQYKLFNVNGTKLGHIYTLISPLTWEEAPPSSL